MNDLKGPAAAVNDTKGMAGAAQKTKPASLKRPGDKGTIKKTSSGKFQPQLFINELNTQRALGSYETAEEAAAVLAAANDKMKKKESVFMVPVKQQAKHGTVATLHLPALCPAYPLTSAECAECADCLTACRRRR